jgi:hypothetical protein
MEPKSNPLRSHGMVACCWSSEDKSEAGEGVPPICRLDGTARVSLGADPMDPARDAIMSADAFSVNDWSSSDALGPALPGAVGASKTLGRGMEVSAVLPVRDGASPNTSGMRSTSRSSSIGLSAELPRVPIPSMLGMPAFRVRSIVSPMGISANSDIVLGSSIGASIVRSIVSVIFTAEGRVALADAVMAENRSLEISLAGAVRAERGARVTGEPNPRMSSSGLIRSEDEDKSNLGSDAVDGRCREDCVMTDCRRARKLDPVPRGGDIWPLLLVDREGGTAVVVGETTMACPSSLMIGDTWLSIDRARGRVVVGETTGVFSRASIAATASCSCSFASSRVISRWSTAIERCYSPMSNRRGDDYEAHQLGLDYIT